MVLQYIYSNNSVEEGYETRKVTNKNKKLYFYLDRIIKIKKTNFLVYEHYNNNNHSCINGYKSCDKVNKNNFIFVFVPENDEFNLFKMLWW